MNKPADYSSMSDERLWSAMSVLKDTIAHLERKAAMRSLGDDEALKNARNRLRALRAENRKRIKRAQLVLFPD